MPWPREASPARHDTMASHHNPPAPSLPLAWAFSLPGRFLVFALRIRIRRPRPPGSLSLLTPAHGGTPGRLALAMVPAVSRPRRLGGLVSGSGRPSFHRHPPRKPGKPGVGVAWQSNSELVCSLNVVIAHALRPTLSAPSACLPASWVHWGLPDRIPLDRYLPSCVKLGSVPSRQSPHTDPYPPF